jgi:molecular chaperone DnaK
MVYEVEKNMKEWADQLESSQKERLDGAVEGAKKALRSGAAAEIKSALEELSQAYSAAGASLYQAAQAQQAAEPSGAEAAGDDQAQPPEDVVEADYEIVDEDKS